MTEQMFHSITRCRFAARFTVKGNLELSASRAGHPAFDAPSANARVDDKR